MFLLCLVSRLSQVTYLGKIAYWIAMGLVYFCEIALAGLFVLVCSFLRRILRFSHFRFCCPCVSAHLPPHSWINQTQPWQMLDTVSRGSFPTLLSPLSSPDSISVIITRSLPIPTNLIAVSYGRRYALYIDVQPMCILFAAFFFLPPYR